MKTLFEAACAHAARTAPAFVTARVYERLRQPSVSPHTAPSSLVTPLSPPPLSRRDEDGNGTLDKAEVKVRARVRVKVRVRVRGRGRGRG